eukprot:3981407-Prorocentrum_lima.AAC.1
MAVIAEGFAAPLCWASAVGPATTHRSDSWGTISQKDHILVRGLPAGEGHVGLPGISDHAPVMVETWVEPVRGRRR